MRQRGYLAILMAMFFVLPATGIVNAEEAPALAITEQAACETQVSTDAVEASLFDTEVYMNKCGSCSTHICQGVVRGTYCAPGKWCIPTDTMFCPGTDDWDCQCARHYN